MLVLRFFLGVSILVLTLSVQYKAQVQWYLHVIKCVRSDGVKRHGGNFGSSFST